MEECCKDFREDSLDKLVGLAVSIHPHSTQSSLLAAGKVCYHGKYQNTSTD